MLTFCALFLLCNLVFSQQELDTTKCIFFLDNKRVYTRDIMKGTENESIEFCYGTSSVRSVLLIAGEKYRNFAIFVYVTRRKNEKGEKNN